MDEEYDVIILGTGLTECILSGLLSKEGKKVLHMDRNPYYGGAATSLNPLNNVYKHYKRDVPCNVENSKTARDWNVDLVPKFLMARGRLVKLLIHTDVTRYLEFKSVEGSYVTKNGTNIYKIPATSEEALRTSLMGIFEKRRFKNFVQFAADYNDEIEKSHQNMNPNQTASELYEKFGLDKNTIDIAGHSIGLQYNEDYLHQSFVPFVKKLKLYFESVAAHGKSPYIYPLYGLGELPQAFARLSAIYGGTYMLDKPIANIEFKEGKVEVTSKGETVKGGIVIGDPSYFSDRVHKCGQVVRAICILSHSIKLKDNNELGSLQVIIPANQVHRKNDIYICCLSSAHKVTEKGKFLAIISTIAETEHAENETENAEKEIAHGIKLVSPIDEKFVSCVDIFEPNEDGCADKCFISKSYDASTHFESTCVDILDIYKRVTGKEFEFKSLDEIEIEK